MALEVRATKEAEKLVETLKELLPKDYGYCLLGLHEKTFTWDRGIKDITRAKFSKMTDTGERSAEELSRAQIGFFGNLNNCTKPENLNNFNLEPNIVVDQQDETFKKLILSGRSHNKLGQTVVRLTAIIFREYTDEEKCEIDDRKAKAMQTELGLSLPSQEDMLKDLIGSMGF